MRRLAFFLLVLNGLMLPLGCVPAFVLANVLNPMQLAFIQDFSIENRTAERMLVTPVGTVGPDGHRAPLPLVLAKFPCLPVGERGRFPVPSGGKITLYYDWDDINFSELVIEKTNGDLRQFVVNPTPTLNQYNVPQVTHCVIDDWSKLEPVDGRVLEAYQTAQIAVRLWPMLLGMLVPVVTFVILLRYYRSLSNAVPRPASL